MATGRVGNIKSLGVTVEAAFGYDADDPSPSWTDISTYVMGFSTRRGRKREIDRVIAGTCQVRLENPDRRFEGGYTGGAYGSNVKPMVPIRITCTRNAVTYPVFYGYADEWVPSFDPSQPRTAFVDLRATDAFQALAMKPLDRSVWEMEVLSDSPTVWYRMGERFDNGVMVDSSGNGIDGQYNGTKLVSGLVPFDDDRAREFDGISDYAQVINPSVVTSGDMTLELWLTPARTDMGIQRGVIARQHSVGGDQWILSRGGTSPDGNEVDYLFEHSAGGSPTSGELVPYLHHIVCTHDSGTSNIYLNGTLYDTDSSAVSISDDGQNALMLGRLGLGFDYLTYSFRLDGIVDELAIYPSALDATAVSDHYVAATAPRDGDGTGTRIGWLLDQAGWPAGLRDLDTGMSTCEALVLDGRTVVDLLWEAVEFEDGTMFIARDGDVTFRDRTARYTDTTATASQATYSYTGSNGKFADVTFDYSAQRIENRAKVRTPNGTVYEAVNTTSTGTYWVRTVERRIPQADSNHAQALADWLVLKGKDPLRRITSLKVATARDTTTFDATVGLELGYRITVALDPAGTGTISEAVMVEGIDHDVTPHNWTTTLWCSPDPSPEIVIVGVSLVGGSEVVGY
jgi:hypothetical protein